MSGQARHVGTFSQWTPEREHTLTTMWMSGSSGSEIALVLRVSRNAVIGKVRRLKLAYRTPTEISHNMNRVRNGERAKGGAAAVRKARERSANPKPAKTPAVKSLPVASAIVRRASLAAQPLPKERPFDVSHAKPWTVRKFGECAFPVSGEGADTLSCCLPAPEGSYCPAHRKLMTARPTSEAQRANAQKMRDAKAVKMRRAA
jgi:GcrA cell cycle regulator